MHDTQGGKHMLGAPSSVDCGIGRCLPNLTVDLRGIVGKRAFLDAVDRASTCPDVRQIDQRTPIASLNQDDAETAQLLLVCADFTVLLFFRLIVVCALWIVR